jgi:hypothetical protein
MTLAGGVVISMRMAIYGVFKFCGNGHYLRWWKRQHPQEDAPMSGDLSEL